MIKISKRLLAITSFIKSDAKLVDIGCDHALLDIYLAHHNPDIKIIATDIKTGALKQASKNINKYNMLSNIDLRLSDGLEKVSKDEIDTIVISGLGYHTIIDILTKDKSKLDNVQDLIIQSNNEHYNLRKSICSLGYYITSEKLVKDSDIIYLIVHFKKGKKKYHYDDYLFGPCLRLLKDDLYKELIKKKIKKKEIILSLIPRKFFIKRYFLKNMLIKLKKEIK